MMVVLTEDTRVDLYPQERLRLLGKEEKQTEQADWLREKRIRDPRLDE